MASVGVDRRTAAEAAAEGRQTNQPVLQRCSSDMVVVVVVRGSSSELVAEVIL